MADLPIPLKKLPKCGSITSKFLGSFGQDISFDENFRDHVTTSVLRELSSDLNHDENLKSQ